MNEWVQINRNSGARFEYSLIKDAEKETKSIKFANTDIFTLMKIECVKTDIV